MANLASSLPDFGFTVHLGIVERNEYLHKGLPPQIQTHRIGAHRVLFGAFGLIRLVWKVRPELILSGMFHLNHLVMLLRIFFPRRIPILLRQNGMLAPSRAKPRSVFISWLYRLTYPRADGIICQTRAMAAEWVPILGSNVNVHVLPNPVDGTAIRRSTSSSRSQWRGDGPHLLAVGRLSFEKGFDLLLNAFAALRSQVPEADLTILGQGTEETLLRARCSQLGFSACVRFEGYVADPEAWYPGAALLVIPSRLEALPNAMLEAASAGLPIVSMPCSAGVKELLHGRSGVWLAREVSSDALAKSLLAALATLQPGQRFAHEWLKPYELDAATGGYAALIRQTLSEQKR